MAVLEVTESVCTEIVMQEYGGSDSELLCGDTGCLLSQLGSQFPTAVSSPWSFYSDKLRMRLVCTPATVSVRGVDLVRLSVKAEVATCRRRIAMQRWLDDDDDRTSFWINQGGYRVAPKSSIAGGRRIADLMSWMTKARTRSKRQRLIA